MYHYIIKNRVKSFENEFGNDYNCPSITEEEYANIVAGTHIIVNNQVIEKPVQIEEEQNFVQIPNQEERISAIEDVLNLILVGEL